jgi:glycerol-3-phosphate O-acyltransferase
LSPDYADEKGIRQDVAAQSARSYAREIVPGFSAATYFGFAIRVARWLSRALYRVRLGSYDEATIRAIDPNATVVFVMNHRSNMDYVLVTYLVAERSALSYAVGEWARVWPLQSLIRAMGAYFIRRRHLNPLYRRVLARYVQMATPRASRRQSSPRAASASTARLALPRRGCCTTSCRASIRNGAMSFSFRWPSTTTG